MEAYNGLNVFNAFCNKKRGNAIETNASTTNSARTKGSINNCLGFEMISQQ